MRESAMQTAVHARQPVNAAGTCRMLWSFSRDGGIPFHRLWSAINPTSGTPILAVWAMVTFAFLLGLPMLHSTAAFQAVTSISTIGLYISCKLDRTTYLSFDLASLGFCLDMLYIPEFGPQAGIPALSAILQND